MLMIAIAMPVRCKDDVGFVNLKEAFLEYYDEHPGMFTDIEQRKAYLNNPASNIVYASDQFQAGFVYVLPTGNIAYLASFMGDTGEDNSIYRELPAPVSQDKIIDSLRIIWNSANERHVITVRDNLNNLYQSTINQVALD